MPGKFIFDDTSMRYRERTTGRFVRRQFVIDEVLKTIEVTRAKVRAISERLQRGQVSLAGWQGEMRDAIKAQHVLSAGLAIGGKNQFSPAVAGRLGALTREQYKYLSSFAKDVSTGKQALNARFLQRAGMYANAGYSTFIETERGRKRRVGFDEERNVINARESCTDCLGEAAKGWVEAGNISRIGSRSCRQNCRCDVQTRKAA